MHVRLACALQSYTPAAEALIKAAKAPGQDAGSYINAAKRVAPGSEASMHVTPLNQNQNFVLSCSAHSEGGWILDGMQAAMWVLPCM